MTYCCSVFPKIAKRLKWSIYKDRVINPCINTQSFKLLINFCPSCGADIRGIVISKDEFDKLK